MVIYSETSKVDSRCYMCVYSKLEGMCSADKGILALHFNQPLSLDKQRGHTRAPPQNSAYRILFRQIPNADVKTLNNCLVNFTQAMNHACVMDAVTC